MRQEQEGTTVSCRGIPCMCGKVYIGTTKRSMATRVKEHQRNCRLGQTEKSAVAEQALREGYHKILFDEVKLLAISSGYYSRLVREAIKIHKYTGNLNKETSTRYNLRSGVRQSATSIRNRRTFRRCSPLVLSNVPALIKRRLSNLTKNPFRSYTIYNLK